MRFVFAVGMLVLAAGVARAEEREVVVVTAAPPLDAERLADALRIYLDNFAVDVRTAPAAAPGELRQELAGTRTIGDQVRALAAVRVADADGTTAEIQLVDRSTGKTLIASVPRASRDEDFYRTVALKVQGLLRSALYERVEQLTVTAPTLARLVAPPAKSPPHRLSLEAAYALVSFPLGGVVQHGVGVLGRFELARFVELGLGVDALVPVTARRGDVTAVVSSVPILVSANLHLRRPRFEGAVGAVGELLVVVLDASSASAPVRSDRFVAPALGVQAAGRVRLTSVLWLYLRASVLGVIDGENYTVRGASVVELARLQVNGEAGLGVAVW